MIGPLIYIFIFYTHLIHNWLAFWHGSSASVDTRQWFAFFVLPKKIKAAIYYYSIPHTNTKYVISQFLSNFCHISSCLYVYIFFNTCAFWTPLTHIIYIYLYIASLVWSWRGGLISQCPRLCCSFHVKNALNKTSKTVMQLDFLTLYFDDVYISFKWVSCFFFYHNDSMVLDLSISNINIYLFRLHT